MHLLNMLWGLLCSFAVFTTALSVGVQSAETPTQCVNRLTTECSTNIKGDIDPLKGLNICRAVQTVSKCLENAMAGCSVTLGENQDFKNFMIILTDFCKEGTDLNKKFLESEKCLMGYNFYISILNCPSDFFQAYNDRKLVWNNENQLTIAKLACKYLDSMKNCLFGKAKEICGDGTESLLKTLLDPTYKMSKEYCVQIGGAANLSVNITYFILHALSVMFLFKWFNF